MAGVKGLSGGQNKVSVAKHRLRGSYRPSRHAARAVVVEASVIEHPAQQMTILPADLVRVIDHQLEPGTAAWVRSVGQGWRLDAHHVRLLVAAGRAWDEAEAAAELVKREGVVVDGARHPASKAAIDARHQFVQLLRTLDLEK
ncbi:MAG: hypothetical protein H0X67_02465 [Acidobacteria bacterium]|nr:hypothetical protein [Acidobacteriota bacterium]